MPPNNNPLGNRRRQQNRRNQAQAQDVASPRRAANLRAGQLPNDMFRFIRRGFDGLAGDAPRPRVLEPRSVEYGDSTVYHWRLDSDPATLRRALWTSTGDNDADIDASLQDLITARGGAQPTTLRLSLEPTLDDSPAKIQRVVQAIAEHNQNAPDGQKIELETNSGYVRALRDGWANADSLTMLDRDLGRASADALITNAIATEHPSRIGAMIENLATAAVMGALPDNNSVLIGDSLRVWSRIDRALGSMLTPPLGEAPDSRDPPQASFPGRDAAWLRARVRDLLPGTAERGLLAVRQLIEDVANYERGLREPLLRRFNDNYRDPQAVAEQFANLPLDTAHLPGGSTLRQAIYVLAQLGDSTPAVAVQTMAQSGPELVNSRLRVPDRADPQYQAILTELDRRHTTARGELESIELEELADILFEARRTGQTPRLITSDSHVLRTLRGLNPGDVPIADSADPQVRQIQIAGVPLELREIPSPTSDYPFTTQVGDLAAELATTNRPLEFGQALKIAKPDGTLEDAYLFGYGPTGLARVLLREPDGAPPTRLYNVAENETISAAEDFPDLANYQDDTSITVNWNSQEHRLADIEAGPRPADGTPERLIYDNIANLRGLKLRQVAGSTKTAEQFTDTISDKNFRSWIVGGATRDILQGLNPADIDFATTMPAIDSYTAIVNAGLARKKPRQNDPEDLAIRRNVPFGTVQVEADVETGLDIISTHDGHDSSLLLDLDALARDFTINAVYYDFDAEVVVDPTGQGLDDLANRRLNFVYGTAQDVLSSEPVMIARWMRMIGKGYNPGDPNDRKTALEWLVKHARPQAQGGMENPVRQRFVDRMKNPKLEAEALARQVFGNLQAGDLDQGFSAADMQAIAGTDNPADAAVWAIRQIFR
ncbi:hypothetical protein G6O69_36195 [Pseudenhygromyxa sp. WMMC2535]|uniref:hypothetical protein n=1 Tax=Pseudenhygromyxa sp. WMMC2535 TaxID=2712867 RepID=UPI00155192D3|nr:hypothetical protein [Pseudenhygromyxa sp. WMMC2535]NVB43323.1 hypothetical protein [Pseudenhygromyxa sp. WMMC2535]